MSYQHLSLEERYYIEVSLKKGMSHSNIANNIGRSQGSISREIKRNKGLRGYRYQQADTLAQCRHTEKNKDVKLTDDIKRILDEYISKDWSPKQIAGRLQTENVIDLHHETIYQYILDDKRAAAHYILT